MNYFIIAGEISGDLQGAKLVEALITLDNKAVFKGVGGNCLKNAGVEIIFGLERTAFMGFFEVVKNIRTVQKNFKEIKTSISVYAPDVVILIDYPGFNLRIAKWCKQQGIKVVYYISPKFWAWRESRVEKVKANVDLMLCILPFEVAFYQKHQYSSAYYVGHPLMHLLQNKQIVLQKNTIALLPGSRKQEIISLLPIMLKVAQQYPNEIFKIAGIKEMETLYPKQLPANVQLSFNNTYALLQEAKAALVCSGTSTLETALLKVPQVVLYKTSWLNYQIGKRVIKVPYISLPNLIANTKIVEELIQQECNVQNISTKLNELLNNINSTTKYQQLYQTIGVQDAAKNAAILISKLLNIN